MNKTKLFKWIIILLIALNIATITSGIIYSSKRSKAEYNKTEVPFIERANFFYEQLGLSSEQRISFMEFNQDYNQKGRAITNKMNSLRFKMINEMSEANPDRETIDEICNNIGDLHRQLKVITVDYYFKMKSICDKQQQESLNQLFERMLNSDGTLEQIRPHYGRRNDGRGMGRGRQNRNLPVFN